MSLSFLGQNHVHHLPGLDPRPTNFELGAISETVNDKFDRGSAKTTNVGPTRRNPVDGLELVEGHFV